MYDVRIDRRERPASARRGRVGGLVRLACGVALTLAVVGFSGMQPAAAQDDETITLSAGDGGGATLSVTPGGEAVAASTVAVARAEPGHAETIASSARAVADCEDGALAEGAAALAVAHPDEGALTQSSTREMVASIQEGVRAQLAGEDGDDGPVRKIVENECGKDEEKKAPPKKEPAPAPKPEPAPAPAPAPEPIPVQLPDTGIGMAGPAGLSSLLGVASAAAAMGAVALRDRRQPGLVATISDDQMSAPR
jgi:hypothetical protein